MKKAILLGIILAATLAAACVNVYAEETAATVAPAVPIEGQAAAAAEEQEAYGEVVSVDTNASSVTITEYDYEKDEDVSNAYIIDKAATYENVKSLAEVKAGDWVALNIKPQKEGVKTATSVYVERYDMGEEAMPLPAAVTPAAEPEAVPVAAPAAEEATQ